MNQNEKFKVSAKLAIPEGVSVVVPFHSKYEHTTKLLETVYRYAKNFDLEVILIDDASPNANYITQFKDVAFMNPIRLEKSIGFGAAVNGGFKIAKYPNVLAIHSDCRIDSNTFFLNLYNSLSKFNIVSPKTNNPVCGDPKQEGDRNSTEDYQVVENFLSLYAFMAKRDWFNRMGGLKPYPYAGYENRELAVRMAMNNQTQGVCGKAWVFHEGEVTVKEVARKDQSVRLQMEANRELYLTDLKKLVG